MFGILCKGRRPAAGCTSKKVWNGMTTSWERGRPARTRPGTASAIPLTSINRERRHCAPSVWLMRFPPTGSPPATSMSWLATRGISGRSGAPWRRTPFKRAGCGRPGTGRGSVCMDRMRAGRPRSQAMTPGCSVGGWWATSHKSDLHPASRGSGRSPGDYPFRSRCHGIHGTRAGPVSRGGRRAPLPCRRSASDQWPRLAPAPGTS